MKKSFSPPRLQILLAGILLALALCISVPERTAAQNIVVSNHYDQKLSVAVVAKPVGRDWIVKGWWTVEPYSSRELVLNSAAGSEKIYVHAHTQEASWGTEKRYTVINSAFEYTAGQPCPNGNGRRQVGFDCYYFDQNGYLYLDF